jgi:hypothetical protein
MLSPNFSRPLRADLRADQGAEPPRLAPVWNGILLEFRNHLTGLMAAATELRTEIPPSLALQVGQAVGETERNVQSLSSLLALVDASVRTVEPLISDLDGILDRAIRLATPALGRRATISAKTGHKVGVKNRGSALECLLAALIVDLARAQSRIDGNSVERAHPVHLEIHPEISRGSLAIEIESDGPRPQAGSWRFLLACDLAAKLDAEIALASDVAAYVVHVH